MNTGAQLEGKHPTSRLILFACCIVVRMLEQLGLFGYRSPAVSRAVLSCFHRKTVVLLTPIRQYTLGGMESSIERVTVKPLESRKTFLVDSYKHLMEENRVVLFLHYNNLLKHEDHHYRSQIKQLGGKLTVLRNNLFKLYLKNSRLDDPCAPVKTKDQDRSHPLLPLFKGPTAAVTFPETNPKDVANVLKLLEKAQDKLFVVGAKIEAEPYDLTQLNQYKLLPDKAALQGQLLGVLHTLSGAGLVRTLETASQSLYLTLSSHRDNNTGGEKDS